MYEMQQTIQTVPLAHGKMNIGSLQHLKLTILF